LIARAQARRDQQQTDDGAVEEAQEDAERELPPAEVPEREAEREREPHVAEPHPVGIHEVDDEEADEGHRGGDERTRVRVPVVVARRPEREQDEQGQRQRVHDPVRQQEVLEVDHREHDEPEREHEVRGERPRVVEARADRTAEGTADDGHHRAPRRDQDRDVGVGCRYRIGR
jgi:hypothetical protein